MDDRRCVLIVDQSEESREVLQTALERKGWRILSTGRTRQAVELAEAHHPDLIVLDLELDGSGEALSARFGADSTNPTPLVMLGSLRRRGRAREGEFVAKPYHYGPLVRRIEELLARAPQAGTRGV